jgi:hypothetical protein
MMRKNTLFLLLYLLTFYVTPTLAQEAKTPADYVTP